LEARPGFLQCAGCVSQLTFGFHKRDTLRVLSLLSPCLGALHSFCGFGTQRLGAGLSLASMLFHSAEHVSRLMD
jgi:hypothetical protein